MTDIINAISFEYTKETKNLLTLDEHVPVILKALKDEGKLPSDAKMTGFSKIANIAWKSIGMKEGEWFNGSWVKDKAGAHSLYKISRSGAVGGYHWLWKSPSNTKFHDPYNDNYINNPTPAEDHYIWLKNE